VQEILIDGSQFILQRLIEEIEYFRVTLHGCPFFAHVGAWIAFRSAGDCMPEGCLPASIEG
jgi:hypothetical protein